MPARANDTLDKVQDLQKALYRAAKVSATRRFHALYELKGTVKWYTAAPTAVR